MRRRLADGFVVIGKRAANELPRAWMIDAGHRPEGIEAQERRIGEFFKRPTLPFNGYSEQVARMYEGMDLRKNF